MPKKKLGADTGNIQTRFFEALTEQIAAKNTSLKAFCEAHGLNRVKYSNIRSEMNHPDNAKPTNYKVIDIEALCHLCNDFNISAEWLLTGRGAKHKRK